MYSRRKFLQSAVFAGATSLMASRLALAAARTEARFVFVLLRGALDGLHAVPPVGDPRYASLRGTLALARDVALPLDGPFALHPSLRFLHSAFGAGELAVFHAVATPYRERSHFDAQNVLESGGHRPQGSASGWINRALTVLPARAARDLGVALGANVPLAMRGPAAVASWSPSRLPSLEESTLARLTDLYAPDALLSRRLADALQSESIARDAQEAAAAEAGDLDQREEGALNGDARQRGEARGRYRDTARAAAGFLRQEDGARVAMFDTSGWDTHANQGGAQGALAARLAALDAALAELKQSLGAVWRHTTVLVATEFGRTAAINGTRGTDHGTGAAAFLLGGAVRGGRVITDWPGLGAGDLLEARDLRPTLDLRAIMKGVLRDHLRLPEQALALTVFPDSTRVRPMEGLVRDVGA